MKNQHSVVPKGPINLITNNFRIRSQNHGIIHTYAVSFIERDVQIASQKFTQESNNEELAEGSA
jgi:hypothetical protein